VSIAFRLNLHRARRWHLDLQKILQARTGENIFFVFDDGPGCSLSIELLLELEKALFLHSGPSPIDKLTPRDFDCPSSSISDARLIVDLTGNGNQISGLYFTLTPLFDGVAPEESLIGALIADRAPVIEILAGPTQEIVASLAPALDEARSVRERFEFVVRHTQRALLQALLAPRARTRQAATKAAYPSASAIGRYAARLVASAAVRRAYQLCLFSPHWRLGWRFVEDEGGVWSRHALDGVPWNSVADPGYRFYADPFPFAVNGKTFIFVEGFDHREGKGTIAAIPFDEQGQAGPAETVLSEPCHLSYPYLFVHREETWMIPESSQDRRISLYRSNRFPTGWVREADLLKDIDASDASLVQFGGKWWIFATTRDELGGAMDSLSLFHADDLFGPWLPHPANPVLVDAAGARQGGWFAFRDGRLWRPVQDCRDGYGRALGLAEVTVLNEHDYAQKVHTVLRPDVNWPGRRLHTLNCFGKLECIDGSRNSWRFGAAVLGSRRVGN
jgi:hypothetical protein